VGIAGLGAVVVGCGYRRFGVSVFGRQAVVVRAALWLGNAEARRVRRARMGMVLDLAHYVGRLRLSADEESGLAERGLGGIPSSLELFRSPASGLVTHIQMPIISWNLSSSSEGRPLPRPNTPLIIQAGFSFLPFAISAFSWNA
jgi:hypothetical protein